MLEVFPRMLGLSVQMVLSKQFSKKNKLITWTHSCHLLAWMKRIY